MKLVKIKRGNCYYNALAVLSKPLRNDISHDIATLAAKFISFEKDIAESENGGVIASTRWIKNDVAHILDKLTDLIKLFNEEEHFKNRITPIYDSLYEKIYETCLNSNVVHINEAFLKDMTKYFAHCIADLDFETYEPHNKKGDR